MLVFVTAVDKLADCKEECKAEYTAWIWVIFVLVLVGRWR